MRQFVSISLSKIGFADRYVRICNAYKEYDKGAKFSKQQLSEAFSSLGFKFDYSSSDKTFFKDYSLGILNLRFAMSFKYGFIECFYTIVDTSSDERIRFNSIAALADPCFAENVSYNFPISTSEEDLVQIIPDLINLHLDFIKAIKQIKEIVTD